MPRAKTCIHGDYHPGNIMKVGDELYFIDMGDFAVAHPYEDVAQIFLLTAPGFSPDRIQKGTTKMEPAERAKFIEYFLDEYFDHPSEEALEKELNEIYKFALMRIFFFIENFPSGTKENTELIRKLLKLISL
ncbi:MAG: phosphotransferase [Bacilli bacterium]|nr:phosphotransferase [Bacilli bacterium]